MAVAHFFTFGGNHETADGISLGRCFLALRGDFTESRDKIVEARGMKWSFQYTAKEFDGQAARFGLHEVSIDDIRLPMDKR